MSDERDPPGYSEPVGPALPPGLLYDLTAIDGEASAPSHPGAAAAAPAAPPPPVEVDYVGEARDVIAFAYESFVPLYPRLEKVYTEDKRERIANAAGKLMAKYGVTFESLLAGWGAELHFAMVVIPVIIPTVKAVKADMADQDAAAAAAERTDPPPAPAAPAQASPATPPTVPPSPNIPMP